MTHPGHVPRGLLGIVLVFTGCTSTQVVPATGAGGVAGQVTGSVTYHERIALPPGAVVKIRLVDVSRADAPAALITEQVIHSAGRQVPFEFTLAYDAARILSTHTYAVQARIEVDGTLLFISDTVHPVITRGAPMHVDIVLRRS